MHSCDHLFPEGQYSQFVADVVEAASVTEWSDSAIENATHMINGAAAAATKTLIHASVRALNGIFFTDRNMADRLIDKEIAEKLINGGKIFDPACGAGNLLLAAAAILPIANTIEETILAWSMCLGGSDINSQFVDACKVRLVLLAIKRHGFPLVAKSDVERLRSYFTNIVKVDYLKSNIGGDYDVIITNPPYFHQNIESDWSSGKTQVAGLFVAKILERGKSGQIVAGILPDVLRSGSRYKKWRKKISLLATIADISVFGKFSETIDVDVFFLKFTLNDDGNQPYEDWASPSRINADDLIELSSLFEVSVGGVVPHRHKDVGEKFPYLTTRNTKPNSVVESIVELRGFKGRKYKAPFLVVRRTSNPGDVNRVVVSLIKNGQDIAIENHLIVIAPKNRPLWLSKKLFTYLQSDYVKAWINHQIRCRHLTTNAIKNIPIPKWGFHDSFTP